MKDFITILLFIISVVLFCILLFKKFKINEINKNIEIENEKLLKDKEIIINEIKILNKTKEEKQIDLDKINEITSNMNAAAHDAFTQYQDSLNAEYENAEADHDEAIEILRKSYDELQDILMLKVKSVQSDLDKISATRAAALQAQLKEEEIKNKQFFYCPQVPETDLKDAKVLKDIEYKLNNPRVLRMLI